MNEKDFARVRSVVFRAVADLEPECGRELGEDIGGMERSRVNPELLAVFVENLSRMDCWRHNLWSVDNHTLEIRIPETPSVSHCWLGVSLPYISLHRGRRGYAHCGALLEYGPACRGDRMSVYTVAFDADAVTNTVDRIKRSMMHLEWLRREPKQKDEKNDTTGVD